MKTVPLFCCCQLLLACTSSKETSGLKRVVFKPEKYLPEVTAYVPPGYKLNRSEAEGAVEYTYYYPDSSGFYISSFQTPHSYHEIAKMQAFYKKENAWRAKQELLLAGEDSLGRHWKDRTVSGLSIGYYRVKKTNLELMEKAMSTVSIKK